MCKTFKLTLTCETHSAIYSFSDPKCNTSNLDLRREKELLVDNRISVSMMNMTKVIFQKARVSRRCTA